MLSYKFLHIRLLTRRLLLLLGIYFICRVIFLAYNFDSFSNSSSTDLLLAFLSGMVFDLSAIVYINLLYILMYIPTLFTWPNRTYDKILTFVFIVTNFAGILFNIIDIEYFRFQKKRTGFELFSGENEIWQLLPSYIKDYWWLLIISFLLTYLLYRLYKNTLKIKVIESKPYVALKTISVILYLGLLVIAARGGTQTKPLQTISASQFGNPQNASLVLNTPFTILQSIGKKTIVEKKYFLDEELEQNFQLKKDYSSNTLFESKNIVVFILESFSNEYIGALNKKISYSPFLDSLINESYFFENGFANGKKSNEAVPSILASLPSLLDEAYTGSVYQNNDINTLPNLLKTKGYYSAFFHGGFNGSMNFDAFAKKAGFDEYYGMNEYDNTSDFDGHWGIYDEPFMQYFAQVLGSAPKPFFASLFTLSSHPPFAIPEEYQLKYKKIDTDKHRSFVYTDNALRKFFDYAKTKKWYYNTLFIILPDHTPDAEDKYFDTKVSYYKIPIIFYDPSRNWKGRSTRIASQVDIMPTVLDYLHFDKPFNSFGKSLWRDDEKNYSINYRDGIFQIIDSTFVLQYSDDKVIALYNYQADWYLANNIKDVEVEKCKELKKAIEAYIQKFNVTLIKNNYSK